jgi:hypothetical protein
MCSNPSFQRTAFCYLNALFVYLPQLDEAAKTALRKVNLHRADVCETGQRAARRREWLYGVKFDGYRKPSVDELVHRQKVWWGDYR